MIKRVCRQCGKEFILSDSELKFYKSKNLTFPKRCKECRAENRKKSRGRAEQSVQTSDNDINTRLDMIVDTISPSKSPEEADISGKETAEVKDKSKGKIPFGVLMGITAILIIIIAVFCLKYLK